MSARDGRPGWTMAVADPPGKVIWLRNGLPPQLEIERRDFKAELSRAKANNKWIAEIGKGEKQNASSKKRGG